MSLQTVCAGLAAIAARPETGLASCHFPPPEALGRLPAGVVYPGTGVMVPNTEDVMWTHQLLLVVYVATRAGALPNEAGNLAPLVNAVEEAVRRAFMQHELPSGVNDMFARAYSVGVRDFAGTPHHAIDFTVQVKEHTL